MDAALPLPAMPTPRIHPLVERASPDRPSPARADGDRVDDATKQKLRKAAGEFESVFISQMLGHMFDGVETDETFGGGEGETMFRSLLVNEYGKQVTARGGLGLADAVYRELLRAQEAAHG